MDTHQAPAALQAQGLSCRRGNRRLFDRLDLHLSAGQLVWLRADNGLGKTSLLRLLAGLATPEAGDIRLGGLPLRLAAAQGLRPVYIGHANGLKDDLSTAEALQFLACLHGQAAGPGDIRSALARLGLTRCADLPVRTLSQGQRRRAALARLALQTAPLLWLLDEPFDALDAGNVQVLEDLLREHLARGGSAVFTSHQMLSPSAPAATSCWLGAHGLEFAA